MEWAYEPIPDGGPLAGGVRPVRQRASLDASQRGVRLPAVLVLVCMEDESHFSHTCRLLRACVEVDEHPYDVACPGQENHVGLLDAWRNLPIARSTRMRRASAGEYLEESFVKWRISKFFAVTSPVIVPKLAFVGGQYQRQCRVEPGYLTVMGRTEGELSSFQDCSKSACLLGAGFRLTSDARFVLVPARLVQHMRDKCAAQANQPAYLLMPASVCPTSIRQEAAVEEPAGQADRFSELSKEGWRKRPERWREILGRPARTPLQEVLFARLAFMLSNSGELKQVTSLVARIICPELDVSTVSVPTKRQVRELLLKLDLLHALSRRAFSCPGESSVRRARYLSADSSPQGNYDFFCVTEEILTYRFTPGSSSDDTGFDPWGGFEHEFRSLLCVTLGRGETRAAKKVQALMHLLNAEYNCTGDALLLPYRAEVRGFLSDQGTEKLLCAFPVGKYEDIEAAAVEVEKQSVGPSSSDGSSSRFPLFYDAFEQAGILHIVFNALEDAVTSLDFWPRFQKQLSAVTKLLGTKSYRDVVLNKMMSSAPKAVSDMVSAFQSQLLTWRWETLEKVLEPWIPFQLHLKEYWCGDVLSSGDSVLRGDVDAALEDPLHEPLSIVLWNFAKAVGAFASFFEGCYCHEHILISQTVEYRRQQAMISDAGSDKCPWKGKRLPTLALGQGASMLERLWQEGGSDVKAMLLNKCPQSIAAQLAAVDRDLKVRFCATVLPKLEYAQHIPYKICGAYAQYIGLGLEAGKSCVRACFAEWDTIANKSAFHHSCQMFFDRQKSVIAQQLWHFGQSDRALHEYPEALAAIQERCFCSLSERRTEREHVGVKHATTRGLRYAGPAVTCARKRRPQIQEMLDCPRQFQWLLENWKQRKIFHSLLQHIKTEKEVDGMTGAQRLAHVYGYSPEHHFGSTDQIDIGQQVYERMLKACETRLALPGGCAKLDPVHSQGIAFLKTQLKRSSFFSLPPDVFAEALVGSLQEGMVAAANRAEVADSADPFDNWNALRLQDFLLAKENEVSSLHLASHVFFQVTDNWPEQRAQIQLKHMKRKRTLCVALRLPQVSWGSPANGVRTCVCSPAGAEHVLLDLERIVRGTWFSRCCHECLAWRCEPVGLAMNLQLPQKKKFQAQAPTASLVLGESLGMSAWAPSTTLLPDFVDDDDCLEALLPSDRDDETYPCKAATIVSEVLSDRFILSEAEKLTVMSVIGHGAVGDQCVPIENLHWFTEAALFRLLELGLLKAEQDEFGSSCVSIVAPFEVCARWQLSSPQSLCQVTCEEGDSFGRAGRSKLALLRSLLQEGWRATGEDSSPDWHRKGGPKLLPGSLLDKPEIYLRTLFLLPYVWEKANAPDKVCHKGSYMYYAALLGWQDLKELQLLDVSAAAAFGRAKRRRRSKGPEDSRAAGLDLPALSDLRGPAEGDPDPGDVARLLEGLGADLAEDARALPRPLLEQVLGEEPVCLDLPAQPGVASRLPDIPDTVVYFDNMTHQSAQPRAFVTCARHARCRRYIFLHKFATRAQAVAFLLAWSQAAARFPNPDQCEDHIAYQPPDAAVAAVQWQQAHGRTAADR